MTKDEMIEQQAQITAQQQEIIEQLRQEAAELRMMSINWVHELLMAILGVPISTGTIPAMVERLNMPTE